MARPRHSFDRVNLLERDPRERRRFLSAAASVAILRRSRQILNRLRSIRAERRFISKNSSSEPTRLVATLPVPPGHPEEQDDGEGKTDLQPVPETRRSSRADCAHYLRPPVMMRPPRTRRGRGEDAAPSDASDGRPPRNLLASFCGPYANETTAVAL